MRSVFRHPSTGCYFIQHSKEGPILMSAVRNLEALISIENDLKSQYEDKLTKLEQQVATAEAEKSELAAKIEEQLQTIKSLSSATDETKRLEQLNREISNRSEKLQSELDSQKNKIKSIQKETTELKSENKSLKQFDAEKMKKNLAATKKKLTDERNATSLINKSLSKQKTENTELKSEIEELKAEVEKLKPDDAPESTESTEAA